MRIIHAPLNISGQAGILCRELRRRKYRAFSISYVRNYLNYPVDKIVSRKEMARFFWDHWQEYDVFHFWWGQTMVEDLSDLPFLVKNKKKVVMRHCGGDLRLDSIALRRNPYVKIVHPYYQTEQQITQHLRRLSSYIDHVIVQDPEMEEYARLFYRHVHMVPRAIELEKFQPVYPSPKKKRPLVIHSPSNRDLKGTSHVIRAVERLRRYIPFDFELIEKKSHAEAVRLYRNADIAIDQLLIGTYGVFSVEMMALGKPVICYIRPDVHRALPKTLPIVSANPDTLYDKLGWLLERPKKRFELGVMGRRYAAAHHDVKKVVDKLIKVYQAL